MSSSDAGRLSGISTLWSVIRQAHDDATGLAARARAELWSQYSGAVRRYLQVMLRDSQAADELLQEFAVCLLRGDFRHANPERGQFRHYMKTAVRHLVYHHRKVTGKLPCAVPPDSPALAALVAQDEKTFDDNWRAELLERALKKLSTLQPEQYAALQLRASQPRLPSHQMAEQLERRCQRPMTGAAVRQMLHRGRALLGELLRKEIGQSLDNPTSEQIDDELRALDLMRYCQTEPD